MGTTLQNGVYLPNEGERNCYAGLKTNWEILDQKVADVTALQQAVAGALHREIVESLPTTDIDPNTIYMVLSGTSATENVYNEFMYVNNAWELIGTSATDLTNYYTKAEVDGKLLLKASASDLTSHTGDTTIHVTASDKTKWNNGVSQAYVFRYSSTALVASSTNANSLLDNTDNLKVGDKVIDSDGVLFSITAIDTANSTFTIGSALIDLALDANVVHTSGVEDIIGSKRFGVVQNFTGYPTIRLYSPTDDVNVLPSAHEQRDIRFTDKNNVPIAYFIFQHRTDANEPFRTCWRQQKVDGTSSYYSVNFNNLGEFYPENNNAIKLGTSLKHWSEVYATNYYYGANNVEFSTKFVTTDTAQTISGAKTFSSNVNVYNSDSTTDTANIILKNSKAERGTEFSEQSINFVDKNNNPLAKISCYGSSGNYTRLYITAFDSNNNSEGIFLRKTTTAIAILPTISSTVWLGNSIFPFYNVHTKRINSLTPSSLSLPDLANGIDISSYITIGDTDNNYTPPANGWIWIRLIGNGASILQGDFGINSSYVTNTSVGEKWVETNLFVTKDVQATIRCRGITGIVGAKFYPCQGNV